MWPGCILLRDFWTHKSWLFLLSCFQVFRLNYFGCPLPRLPEAPMWHSTSTPSCCGQPARRFSPVETTSKVFLWFASRNLRSPQKLQTQKKYNPPFKNKRMFLLERLFLQLALTTTHPPGTAYKWRDRPKGLLWGHTGGFDTFNQAIDVILASWCLLFAFGATKQGWKFRNNEENQICVPHKTLYSFMHIPDVLGKLIQTQFRISCWSHF